MLTTEIMNWYFLHVQSLCSFFVTFNGEVVKTPNVISDNECSHAPQHESDDGCEMKKCYCQGVESNNYCRGQTLFVVAGHVINVIGLQLDDTKTLYNTHKIFPDNYTITDVAYEVYTGILYFSHAAGNLSYITRYHPSYQFHTYQYVLGIRRIEIDKTTGAIYRLMSGYHFISVQSMDAVSRLISSNKTHIIDDFILFDEDAHIIILWYIEQNGGEFAIEVMASNCDPNTRRLLMRGSKFTHGETRLMTAAYHKMKTDGTELDFWMFNINSMLTIQIVALRKLSNETWVVKNTNYSFVNSVGEKIKGIKTITPLYKKYKPIIYWITSDNYLNYGEVDFAKGIIKQFPIFSYYLNTIGTTPVTLIGLQKLFPRDFRDTVCTKFAGNCVFNCLLTAYGNFSCLCHVEQQVSLPYLKNSTDCHYGGGLVPHKKGQVVYCQVKYCSDMEITQTFLLEIVIYVIIIVILIAFLLLTIFLKNRK